MGRMWIQVRAVRALAGALTAGLVAGLAALLVAALAAGGAAVSSASPDLEALRGAVIEAAKDGAAGGPGVAAFLHAYRRYAAVTPAFFPHLRQRKLGN
jgi:hypothetical protein